MNDPEFIKLRNRFLIEVLVVLIFIIPIIFIFVNKFSLGGSKIIKSIKKNETFAVLLVSPEYENCAKVEEMLSNNNAKYYKLDISNKNRYADFLKALSITKDEVIVPTLMYIEEGKLYATLVDIQDEEELNAFVENYELNK